MFASSSVEGDARPLRLHERERLVGLVPVRVQHGDEIAVANRRVTPGRRSAADVSTDYERRAVGRRVQHPRVQRAGWHDVAGVLRGAGHLLDRVAPRRALADDRERRHGLERRRALDLPLEALALGQLAVGHLLRGIGGDRR